MGSYIYEPKGRAAEYAELALNMHIGCPHRCSYCYVREKLRFSQTEPQKRKELLSIVRKEAADLGRLRDNREILLSFMSDPYPLGAPCEWTTEVLRILLSNGLRVACLSKGGLTTLNDFELIVRHKDHVRMAASLTCFDETTRIAWEPGAAPVRERIEALRKFHNAGVGTFASCEPIIHCKESIMAIEASAGVVDQYNVGWLNWTKTEDGPVEAELPSVIDAALGTGARVMLKRDAHRILSRIERQDIISRCGLLFA